MLCFASSSSRPLHNCMHSSFVLIQTASDVAQIFDLNVTEFISSACAKNVDNAAAERIVDATQVRLRSWNGHKKCCQEEAPKHQQNIKKVETGVEVVAADPEMTFARVRGIKASSVALADENDAGRFVATFFVAGTFSSPAHFRRHKFRRHNCPRP
uniref:Uncharacterized protein n=1 Tax=Ditylenchus dipsaci TaxID=166011 RepID=A0A915D372_9BILA